MSPRSGGRLMVADPAGFRVRRLVSPLQRDARGDAPVPILLTEVLRSSKMRRSRPTSARLAPRRARVRYSRPEAEALEGRMLLYSTVGHWTYSSRITYSF